MNSYLFVSEAHGTSHCLLSGSTMKLNENIIKSHKDVLQHYIKNNPEMELQALYAVQALMHKLEHPPGKNNIRTVYV